MHLHENPAANFAWLCRAKLIAQNVGDAELWAAANRAPAAVQRMLTKAAVGAGTTSDAGWGGDYRTSVIAFQDALQTQSVFFRLLSDNAFFRVPLRTRAGFVVANATGWIVGKGHPTPVSKLQLENQILAPIEAAAMIVATRELLNDVSSAGQTAFSKALRGGVADAVDRAFLDAVIDGDIVTIASTGTDADAMMSDLRALMSAVNSVGQPTLYFAVSPDVAKAASTFPTMFPAMSALGGEMLNLPALVSSVLEPGSIVLVDGSGIAAESETIQIRTSFQTSVEMTDDPANDASTGASAQMVSMFQDGSAALMAVVSFGVERLRTNAVAKLTGVEWGGQVTT